MVGASVETVKSRFAQVRIARMSGIEGPISAAGSTGMAACILLTMPVGDAMLCAPTTTKERP